jgi:FKBP-type peptidyl-prolyl cis-trans isomerase
MTGIPVLILVALAAGCGEDPLGPEDVTFHPSLGVDLDQMTRTPSGLYYQVLEEGEGAEVAEAGDDVTFYYTGWLHTGVVIGTNVGGEAATRVLGAGDLPTGFDEGVRGMHLNETRLLVIRYGLAYGPYYLNNIPAYSNLVYKVILVGISKGGS